MLIIVAASGPSRGEDLDKNTQQHTGKEKEKLTCDSMALRMVNSGTLLLVTIQLLFFRPSATRQDLIERGLIPPGCYRQSVACIAAHL